MITSAGLVALAVAMGIGRFAFTPILPMMQSEVGLTLAAAGWLAAANYLGYFVGALWAARLTTPWAVRGGLLLIAVVTFAMGITHALALWLVLRFAAGVASAWVLVHVSAWTLEQLYVLERVDASGMVFAGVGVGIAGAGLLCLGLMSIPVDADHTWQWFGVVALLLTALVWSAFRDRRSPRKNAEPARMPHVPWDRDRIRVALCYAALGFGYIIPATFLPAMAHRYVTNPTAFGLAWPIFGAAAALSTWVAARWLHAMDNRKLWAGCYVLMAIGVGLPVVWPGLIAILIAALLVGGTFMVVTMTGLREARAVAPQAATAFIATLTAAFALTQVIGPVLVSAVVHLPHGFAASLLAAALVLLVAAVALWRSRGIR
ncbi:MAG: YbfB/YjiJ family MFS transporter [Rhodanobacter sp.]|nr:MAG: YbfB/YjiJ family MFS transporter [Rhodanobacter sp.]TAL93970.1 MAG: YbfB/YjiJ family MFS transporter [Rhodanobacter sp.]TAM42744.1 MAG: YbfB/YjiJ family MFS transporter [Rhodanobacter sp.]TAN23352.1 MAG: YbfB/YjiJ family MFS transporter [Rhodanobacter sp.]